MELPTLEQLEYTTILDHNNKGHFLVHSDCCITSVENFDLDFVNKLYFNGCSGIILQLNPIDPVSRHPMKTNTSSSLLWTYLYHSLCGSNFYNVFSYSYDKHIHGEYSNGVSNYSKITHLFYHDVYDAFTYSFDDHQTSHNHLSMDQ